MEDKQFIISDDVRKLIKKETAEHYLREADKELSHTVEVSNRTVERGYQLLTIMVAVLTGSGWVLYSNPKSILATISMICIFSAIVCCVIIALKVISLRLLFGQGKMPKDMGIEDFISYYHSAGLDKYQYVNIIADEIESIQTKIEFNRKDIQHRVYYFGICLDIIIFVIILCGSLLFYSALSGSNL